MNIKSTEKSELGGKLFDFIKRVFAPKLWKKIFIVVTLLIAGIGLFVEVSGVIGGGIIVGVGIYIFNSDMKTSDDVAGLAFFMAVVTVFVFISFGSSNKYKGDITEIPIDVVKYEFVDSTEKIVVTMPDEYKPRLYVINELSDEMYYSAREHNGKPMRAYIVRNFTYDHQDKVFFDSKPSESDITIHFAIGDVKLPDRTYYYDCKDFMCATLFDVKAKEVPVKKVDLKK